MKVVLLALFAIQSTTCFAQTNDLDYFKQFLFQKEDISNDPDFPEYQYRYLMANNFKYVDAQNRNINASASIRMFEDGHFVAVLREMVEMVFPGAPAGTPPSLFPNGCKKIEGMWSVPGTQLVIPGVGLGDRDYIATSYPPQAVKMTFSQDLISKGLSGTSTTFEYGYSNVEDDAQFCF